MSVQARPQLVTTRSGSNVVLALANDEQKAKQYDMATVLPLFDLGRSPTTRDIAQLVKDGGVAALPDARRRGDAATYQEVRCRSALNRCYGMPFMKWTLNPYRGCTHGCHYCFARKYQSHLELDAGDQFASVIFVKTNFVEVLRRELDKPAWAKESIGFGTATDPYQPIEGTYKLSRGTLEALRDAASPVGVVTKGPMIVRDIDVLKDLSARASCRVHISVPTVDEDAWEKLEPGVAHPMQRLKAVRTLVDAGIDCGVLMAPIVPGFSTQPAKIERTIKAIADSGATSLGAMVMHLEGGTRDHFMSLITREYPEMVAKYEKLYASKYVSKDYDKRVQEVVSLMRARYGMPPTRSRAKPVRLRSTSSGETGYGGLQR